jgi:hypothetical protein
MRKCLILAAALALGHRTGDAQSKESLPQKIKRLVDAVSVEDPAKVAFPGEEFYDLPAEALPHLKDALKKKDLRWTARACLAKAIREIDERTRKLDWPVEFEDRRKEFQRIVVDEYQKVSRHDPKWDKPAAEAVREVAEFWGKQHRRKAEQAKKAEGLALEAIQAGCDDPLILYIYARMILGNLKDFTPDQMAEAHEKAAVALEPSKYHPLLRSRGHKMTAEILYEASKYKPSPEIQARIMAHLKDSLRHFAAAIQEDPLLTVATIREHAHDTMELWSRFDDRQKAFDPILAAATKAQPKGALADMLHGLFLVKYAWDARGTSYAKDVKPEAWPLFRGRLKEARVRLENSYKIAPSYHAPELMMSVTLGDSEDRGEMELWFARGIEAFPDDYSLCTNKLYYLEPKWHGSPEEMLQFGRQAALTGNWEGSLPWVLLDAHVSISKYTEKGWQYEPDYAYFEQPAVWSDVKALYDRFLKLYPERTAHRATYAFYAWHGKRWKEAYAQFKILGESPAEFGAFHGAEAYARARQETERMATD